MVKPRWLREHEKRLKREFSRNYGAPVGAPSKGVKVTRINIDPEGEAKSLLQRILQKFGVK